MQHRPNQIFQTNSKIVWGVQEPKPIIGAPPGRQRIRMRNKDVAKLFVKDDKGIRLFYLEEADENHWKPSIEISANFKPCSGQKIEPIFNAS